MHVKNALMSVSIAAVVFACADRNQAKTDSPRVDSVPPPVSQSGDAVHGYDVCRAVPKVVDALMTKGVYPDTIGSWPTVDIPEYQDRQRFVEGKDKPYGPIACVVA